MGIIQCGVHGRQSIMPVCPEIDDAIQRAVPLTRRRVLMVWVCDECWQRHDLGRFVGQVFPDWSDEAIAQFESMRAEALCPECVATADLLHARANGLADPFPVYEHTLTFLQEDAIEQLETLLLQKFEFRESVVVPGQRALSVVAGALTYPLTLKSYYVTSPETQDEILQVVDGFLSERGRPQYVARFYRAENWGPHPRSPRVWHRGPEELLRQVVRSRP